MGEHILEKCMLPKLAIYTPPPPTKTIYITDNSEVKHGLGGKWGGKTGSW